MVICCAAAQAATYRVTYDVTNQKKVSFTVNVNSDCLTIGQNVYSLRQLGTITNSGLDGGRRAVDFILQRVAGDA